MDSTTWKAESMRRLREVKPRTRRGLQQEARRIDADAKALGIKEDPLLCPICQEFMTLLLEVAE